MADIVKHTFCKTKVSLDSVNLVSNPDILFDRRTGAIYNRGQQYSQPSKWEACPDPWNTVGAIVYYDSTTTKFTCELEAQTATSTYFPIAIIAIPGWFTPDGRPRAWYPKRNTASATTAFLTTQESKMASPNFSGSMPILNCNPFTWNPEITTYRYASTESLYVPMQARWNSDIKANAYCPNIGWYSSATATKAYAPVAIDGLPNPGVFNNPYCEVNKFNGAELCNYYKKMDIRYRVDQGIDDAVSPTLQFIRNDGSGSYISSEMCYVPSIGELMFIAQHALTLNSALTASGMSGVDKIQSKRYGSSTINTLGYQLYIDFSNGQLSTTTPMWGSLHLKLFKI
jgi:hypothetical protein